MRMLSRRAFCKNTSLAVAGAFVLDRSICSGIARAQTPGPTGNRVVWVRDSTVTSWDGSSDWFGAFVDQARVDAMVRQGMMALTGESTEALAWQHILPEYSAGERIAIKVNLNNSGAGGNTIDALAQPINSVVAGLKTIGVQESDIMVLEPSRSFVARVGDAILSSYPEVQIWDAWGSTYGRAVTYDSSDSSLVVTHSDANLSDSRLPDQLGGATYLINMPILKAHGVAGVTFTFKNNIGLFRTDGSNPDAIPKYHDFIFPGAPRFSDTASPLVDIYANPHIRQKSVLVLGEAIFGCIQNNFCVPSGWTTFNGDFPCSLFLSTDPVAIDSVMFDVLTAENPRSDPSQAYLHVAAQAGLGTHEHWNDAVERRYASLDLRELDLSSPDTEPPAAPSNLRVR